MPEITSLSPSDFVYLYPKTIPAQEGDYGCALCTWLNLRHKVRLRSPMPGVFSTLDSLQKKRHAARKFGDGWLWGKSPGKEGISFKVRSNVIANERFPSVLFVIGGFPDGLLYRFLDDETVEYRVFDLKTTGPERLARFRPQLAALAHTLIHADDSTETKLREAGIWRNKRVVNVCEIHAWTPTAMRPDNSMEGTLRAEAWPIAGAIADLYKQIDILFEICSSDEPPRPADGCDNCKHFAGRQRVLYVPPVPEEAVKPALESDTAPEAPTSQIQQVTSRGPAFKRSNSRNYNDERYTDWLGSRGDFY